MAEKAAQWSMGTVLKHKNTEIAGLVNISGPEFSLDVEDVTTLNAEGGWEEIIPTILRSGELGLGINFKPGETGHQDLIKAMLEKDLDDFELVFPDDAATTWSFDAYVVGFSLNFEPESQIDAEVTVKISGEPTLADINTTTTE